MTRLITVRQGLKQDLPVLSIGEFGYCTDTNELFIGSVAGNKYVTSSTDMLTLVDGQGGSALMYYDGVDPVIAYRNIQGEVFKNLFLEVEPASGVTFTNGMTVMYAGSVGASGRRFGKPAVLSELKANPNLFLGVVTEVTSEGYGVLNWFGQVGALNTSGKTIGAVVYVGDNGTWTTTKPVSPLPVIVIGLVERVHSSQGRISVRPNVGLYLSQLHDVHTNGHVFVGGETIMYNVSTSRYEVFDLSGALAALQGSSDAKVPLTRKIIGIDLQDDIPLSEFRIALGVATNLVDGLMSKEDKIAHDALVAEKAHYDAAYDHSIATGNQHGTKYSELEDKPTKLSDTGIADVYTKQEVGGLIEGLTQELEDGTVVVLKAEQDAEGNTIDTTYATKGELSGVEGAKVDKVEGKELSSNDFTDEDKEQIEANAEDIATMQETLLGKVDKEEGKGLSQNDFADSYKVFIELQMAESPFVDYGTADDMLLNE